MDEPKVKEIVAHNNKELLSQIKDLVSSSISIPTSIARGPVMPTRPSKCRRSEVEEERSTIFQQEKQRRSIQGSSSLEHKDLPKTKEHLEKGLSLLKERQKLILLADKSPYGWKTVLEYKHHDLAEDDEDEKRIYRAEARAARSSKRFAARSSNS